MRAGSSNTSTLEGVSEPLLVEMTDAPMIGQNAGRFPVSCDWLWFMSTSATNTALPPDSCGRSRAFIMTTYAQLALTTRSAQRGGYGKWAGFERRVLGPLRSSRVYCTEKGSLDTQVLERWRLHSLRGRGTATLRSWALNLPIALTVPGHSSICFEEVFSNSIPWASDTRGFEMDSKWQTPRNGDGQQAYRSKPHLPTANAATPKHPGPGLRSR